MGIPPANISPNCGGPPIVEAGAEPGMGGADIFGAEGGAEEADTTPPPTSGALLSFVSAFFNRIPFLISPKRASRPCITDAAGLAAGAAAAKTPGGGGGGGGAGGPAILVLRLLVWVLYCLCI